MAISFNDIPADVYVPGVYVEIDPARVGQPTTTRPHTALIVGYRLSAGTVAENIPKLVTRNSDAEGFFGVGSQVAEMVKAFRNVNPRTALYAMGVDEASGTAATGTFAISGTATEGGDFIAYIAGKRFSVGVASGDTANTVGGNVASAINADSTLPVTAANVSGTVTFTAKWDGPEGNDIDIQINFSDQDKLPAGITNVTTAMASGATSPSVAGAITAMAGKQYDTIITGIADSTNIGRYEVELDARWDAMINMDGHLYLAYVDTATNSQTFTSQSASPVRNSKHVSIVCPGPTPTPPWIVAANAAAQDAGENDPARPLRTLPLPDVVAPKPDDQFTFNDRNNLLQNGGSTTFIDAAGNVLIEQIVTGYQKDSFGNVDRTFRLNRTKRTASWLRWAWIVRVESKYARHKLADDGNKFGAGQAIVTPSVMRGEAIGFAEAMIEIGLIENLEQFKTDLLVERDSDPNRLNVLMPPDFVNQLAVIATKQNFRN